jgi:hypothetical protein
MVRFALRVLSSAMMVIRVLASAVMVIWIGTGAVRAQAGASHAPNPPHVDNGNHGSSASLTISQRIEANPQLASRLQALLPAGMTLDQAAAGFKNQGQFIAALHVAHNLGIPFAELQTDMTGPNPDSLGQAIQILKPKADASAEVKKADQEATTDLNAK